MARKTSSDSNILNKSASAETSLPDNSPGENLQTPAPASAGKPPAPRRKSARKAVPGDNGGSINTAGTSVDDDMIRRRAYEIWEERGRTEGMPEEDWLRAEAELRSQSEQHKRAS